MPRSEDETVIDVVSFKNQYWELCLEIASRIVESENPAEVIADFVTAMRFGHSQDNDPADALRHCAEDWNVGVYDEEDEYESLFDEDESDIMADLRHIA
jgi:hypothetical protein